MLRKVKLYGDLAKFVGERVLEADVTTAAQAVRFLLVNWPELEKYMADKHYKVVIDDWELEAKELHYPAGGSSIKVIPVVGGAGNNTTRIIIGVALIAVAIFAPAAGIGLGGSGMTFGTTSGAFSWGAAAAMAGNVGMVLTLSGVAGMLTPVPGIPENEQDTRLSFSFSGLQNTSRAGVPVPICYGEVLTGSVTISAGLDTVQVEA